MYACKTTSASLNWLTLLLFQRALVFISRFLCIRAANYLPSTDMTVDDSADREVYMQCFNNGSTLQRETSQFRSPDSRTITKHDGSWNLIAAILDRCFFLIYLIVIIFSTLFIFPRKWMLYSSIMWHYCWVNGAIGNCTVFLCTVLSVIMILRGSQLYTDYYLVYDLQDL